MERDGEPSLGSHRARLPYRPLRLETERKKRHYVVMTLRFSQVSHYGETQSKVRLLFLTAGGFGSMMGHISGSGE